MLSADDCIDRDGRPLVFLGTAPRRISRRAAGDAERL